ncbi:hypothetical protein PhCBS80983_g02093 [Powellomyces hirtus]|uniref:Bromo domain-containing protein n=1 Tax=Powellomyces hirtus TaxID=109895 RepID=A0A507E897_9FUNG|nr:hypothetical protein PhCBS80983_g02093 [Powellomyces hirtus]
MELDSPNDSRKRSADNVFDEHDGIANSVHHEDVKLKRQRSETDDEDRNPVAPPVPVDLPDRNQIPDDRVSGNNLSLFNLKDEQPKSENGDQMGIGTEQNHAYPPSYPGTREGTPSEAPESTTADGMLREQQKATGEGISQEQHTLMQEQLKFCANVLRSIKRLKDARPFQEPVDPVKLGIPTYFDLIKQPMDLATIEGKLRDGRYSNAQQFVEDMGLMFQNCYTFNGRESPVGQNGVNLERSFAKQMERLPLELKSDKSKKRASMIDPLSTPLMKRDSLSEARPKREIHAPLRDIPTAPGSVFHKGANGKGKLSDPELRFCADILRELTKKQHSLYNFPFLLPVDPIALGIPHYSQVIKNPMDLSTMRHKLDAGEYENADEFAADAKLMFENCYTFNPAGTDVHNFGRKLEEVFDRKWKEKAVATSPAPSRSQRASKAKVKTTTHMHDYTSSEDDEEDSDTKQLQLLQQQLQAITSQMDMLQEKRERKRKKRKSMASIGHAPPVQKTPKIPKTKAKTSSSAHPSTTKKPRKQQKPRKGKHDSEDEDQLPPLNQHQKEELSELVSELSPEKIDKVLEIIRLGSDFPDTTDEGEIELDIESLSKSTLWKLYNFVKGGGSGRSPYAKGRPGPKGPRSNKPKPKPKGGPGLSRNTDTSENSESGSDSGESDSN